MQTLMKNMKPYILIGAMALASCAGNNSKTTDTLKTDSANGDSTTAKLKAPAQNMEYCFVHTDGMNAEDTTAVHLIINGGKVTGDMLWLPKEKDKRKGTLTGIADGNIIKAQWHFMQEGQTDSIAVEFKLSSQQLAQKPSMLDTKTGKEVIDPKADYITIYNMDTCGKFKM